MESQLGVHARANQGLTGAGRDYGLSQITGIKMRIKRTLETDTMKREITKVDGNFDENQKFEVAENISLKLLNRETFDLMLFPHAAPTRVLVLKELLPPGRWGELSRRPAPDRA